ncbi:MAG: LytTR family DNA-binding domain-containing protein [Bacteroidota bacterium]
MLRAILIDDEPLALKSLQTDLRTYCQEDVQVVDTCTSPLLALKAIRQNQPDLVFLDISMEGYETDGFGILEILGDIDFAVIFVTSHSEHALRAFKVSAIDYLVKPFSPQELQRAVQKAIKHQQKPDNTVLRQLLDELKQTDTNTPTQISFPISDGFVYMEHQRIMYCIAEGAYTYIYQKGEKRFLTTRGLKTVEEMLPASHFFRIHYSHLINREYLDRFLSKGKGNHLVLMKDGTKLIVSRNRKKEFLAWMDAQTSKK